VYTLRDIYAFVFTFIAALDGRDLLANSIACVYLWDIFYVCIFVVLSLADCNTSYALSLRLLLLNHAILLLSYALLTG